jgi:hypothetical protein
VRAAPATSPTEVASSACDGPATSAKSSSRSMAQTMMPAQAQIQPEALQCLRMMAITGTSFAFSDLSMPPTWMLDAPELLMAALWWRTALQCSLRFKRCWTLSDSFFAKIGTARARSDYYAAAAFSPLPQAAATPEGPRLRHPGVWGAMSGVMRRLPMGLRISRPAGTAASSHGCEGDVPADERSSVTVAPRQSPNARNPAHAGVLNAGFPGASRNVGRKAYALRHLEKTPR